MTFSSASRAIRKRWLLVLFCIVLGTGAAAGATYTATPVYAAYTQLFVSAQAGQDISGAYQGGLFSQQRVKSYADIVDSPAVTSAVIQRLGLRMSQQELAENITASNPLDTVLLDVTVRDESPARARDIAAAVAEEFAALVPRIETPGDAGTAPVKVTVVEQPSLPLVPETPRVTLNLALGLLIGTALGVAAAMSREALDTTVKGVEDVSALTGTAPLGVITYDSKAADHPLVVHDDPRSPRAEAFRQLRTNLQFVDVDSPPRVVVITSSVASEGKSTTSVNLAITLTEAGKQVVLIEGDLRRPRVADYLGLEGAVGLTDVLTNAAALEDVLQSWGKGKLWVLPSGPLPPNPSELLGSRHMRELLEALARRADVVIIDAPPLLPVTDGAVLAQQGDGALLVVRHGHTRREQVTRALESLSAVDARLLGTVINAVPRKGANASGYGYSSEYYETRPDSPKLPPQAGSNILPERSRARAVRP